MNEIGWAAKELREGHRVRRANWFPNVYLSIADSVGDVVGQVKIMTSKNESVIWKVSQPDLFATDWEVAK